MEGTVDLLSEQRPHILWREPRGSMGTVVDCRVIAAEKAGLPNGQVVDITTWGSGLRLTKPLICGQYLTLNVYFYGFRVRKNVGYAKPASIATDFED